MSSNLSALFTEYGIPQSDIRRVTGWSRSTVSRIAAHGKWPARGVREAIDSITRYLSDRGLTPAQLKSAQSALLQSSAQKKVASAVIQTAEAVPQASEPTETQEEASMLLRNENITPAAKRHFKLTRSPFVDDIQSRADVYTTANGRYVSRVMLDAALNHGFVAILGESGSGKSTLRDDLEERIHEENRPIIVIKPYPRQPKKADTKALQPNQIESAIFRALGFSGSRKSDPDDRTDQIHGLLKASRAAGYNHLLVIEEAHRMPVDTLKQLKNFLEMRDRLRRLIGICLIGQTREMRTLLNDRNPEVREIVQRCEQIEMEPLDNDLEGYLTHKFDRIGMQLADVFERDAIDAMRVRLINKDSESICFPLVVNNLVSRALNAAVVAGFPKVDAQVIAGC